MTTLLRLTPIATLLSRTNTPPPRAPPPTPPPTTATTVPARANAASTHLAHGIDCTCYFSQNIFVEGRHYTYIDAAQFEADHGAELAGLFPEERERVRTKLVEEIARRRRAAADADARKRYIAEHYKPLHPALWTLCDDWLHPDLLRAAEARFERKPGPRRVCEGVYELPVFSRLFCKLMLEELSHFRRSGLPMGRPNSMNNEGVLLDELGLTPGLIEPLVRKYIQLACAALPPLAPLARGLDHQKAFVVRYRMGGDESLASHFDNAEVTLNVNLGLEFEGGELVLRDSAGSPEAFHDWSFGGLGCGLLHVGSRVHSALPLSSGERLNLVVWMRSREHRREFGCPMCGRRDTLIEQSGSNADELVLE